MRRLLAFCSMLLVCAVLSGQTADDPEKAKIEVLKAELELQRKTSDARLEEVKKLKAELEAMKEEIQRLRGLLAKAGLDPEPPKGAKPVESKGPKAGPVKSYSSLGELLSTLPDLPPKPKEWNTLSQKPHDEWLEKANKSLLEKVGSRLTVAGKLRDVLEEDNGQVLVRVKTPPIRTSLPRLNALMYDDILSVYIPPKGPAANALAKKKTDDSCAIEGAIESVMLQWIGIGGGEMKLKVDVHLQ